MAGAALQRDQALATSALPEEFTRVSCGRKGVSEPHVEPVRAYSQTNGWTFCEFRAADGSRRQLDTLRLELYERKVSLPTSRRTG